MVKELIPIQDIQNIVGGVREDTQTLHNNFVSGKKNLRWMGEYLGNRLSDNLTVRRVVRWALKRTGTL